MSIVQRVFPVLLFVATCAGAVAAPAATVRMLPVVLSGGIGVVQPAFEHQGGSPAAGDVGPSGFLVSAKQVEPTTARPGPAGAVTLKAVPLIPLRVPGGMFSVAVPEGWHLSAAPIGQQSNGEITIYAPDGRADAFIFPLLSLTNLYVESSGIVPQYRQCMSTRGVLPCSEALVQRLASFTAERYSPRQAFGLLVTMLQRSGAVVQDVRLRFVSADEVEGRATVTTRGRSADDWFLLRMLEVPNPLFAQSSHVEGFVFLRGCEAPVGQLGPAELKPCAAVLGSFRPSSAWAEGPVDRVMTFYRLMGQQIRNRLMANRVFQFGEQSLAQFRQTENVIANWGNRMRQMQMQQFAQSMASNYKITQGWMNALTGSRDLYNPQTGQEYNVNTDFQNFEHYCRTSADVVEGWNGLGSCGPYGTPLRP